MFFRYEHFIPPDCIPSPQLENDLERNLAETLFELEQ